MAAGWRSRIVGHDEIDPTALVPNPANWRTHPIEPFAGSGTTIVAAEQTGRRCLAMEIDPRYAQVSIRRWEIFTGETAARING